ncbi:MAG: methylenetetrahydrofolate reductase, partial [Deltaproteobacteria bacterium]|nr:methylenetetrahydrofolate reductase [Deltaproteobacteria bacterium]
MDFLDRIKQSPLVFDGAMGTEIYDRGVFIQACYDELCLSNPRLVLQIHQDYIEAGAQVIETNTFGANPIKLKTYGLAERTEA